MEQKNDFLGRDPIGRLLWRMSLPAIVAQLINLLYNLVDRVYIGHMPEDGALALTGVGVCLPIIMIVSAFAALVSNGGAPRASMAMGKGDYDEAEKILGNSVALQIVISAVLTVLLLLFYRPLLLTFGASEEYYRLCFGLYENLCGRNGFCAADARHECVYHGAGLCQNRNAQRYDRRVLQYCARPGSDLWIRYGSPRSGDRDGDLAGGIDRLGSLIPDGKKDCIKNPQKVSAHGSGRGTSGAGAWTCPVYHAGKRERDYGLLQCLAAQIRGRRGGGSHDDSIQCDAVFHASDAGTRTGRPPITSYNYGARNAERVKRTFRLLLTTSLCYSMAVWLLIMLFPQMFAMIFSSNAELIAYTKWALRIYCAAMGIFGAQIACQMTFISIGNAGASIIVAIMRKFVLLLPLIYLLPHLVKNQTMGVYLAEPAADVIAVSFTLVLFFFQFKKAIAVIEKPQ